MKRIILFTLALVATLSSYAQLKPTQGNLLTELQFNVGTSINFNIPAMRFRYFWADNMVARLDLSVTGNSSENKVYENPDGTGATGTLSTSNSTTGIGLAVERHLNGSERFSPYYAGRLGYSMTSTMREWNNSTGSAYMADFKRTMDTKSSSVNFSVRLGCDYWIAKSIYLGTELGFAYGMTNRPKSTVETTTGGTTTKTVLPESSSSTFGEMVIPTFRFGFVIL